MFGLNHGPRPWSPELLASATRGARPSGGLRERERHLEGVILSPQPRPRSASFGEGYKAWTT